MKEPIIILANGSFPVNAIPLSILNDAGTIICTDGSADKLISYGKTPDIIIGDMDSISSNSHSKTDTIVQSDRQEDTDLEKAVVLCCGKNIKHVIVLGSQGERDDHGFAALFIQSAYYRRISIQLVTDHYTIDCIQGKKTLSSFSGQTVSILPIYPDATIRTKGLKYELNSQPLIAPSQGISNASTGDSFTVETSKSIWVFRSLS